MAREHARRAKARRRARADIFYTRARSYQEDALANLRNVAIPGTGVPLSLLARSKPLAYLFFVFAYPFVCAMAAANKARATRQGVAQALAFYSEQLLAPKDWFSYWRLNCRLASWHAFVTQDGGYSMENKWDFLMSGEKNKIAVSPWLKVDVCVKHKNEEGGMGIHFYKNAISGGDWIIQTRLSNDAFVASLLPENAPLSTFRIITASRAGIYDGADAGAQAQALSCVFRAGRKGAMTDHDAILFDVDLATGTIRRGTTNMHWYQLGPRKAARTPWLCLKHDYTHHPDADIEVTGRVVPDIGALRALCERAHGLMMPGVPLAGWDVALTAESGACLLEANLMCNFFRGTFDLDAYLGFVEVRAAAGGLSLPPPPTARDQSVGERGVSRGRASPRRTTSCSASAAKRALDLDHKTLRLWPEYSEGPLGR